MSAILGPPFWILKIRCRISNQRPQKPWSTELCKNRWLSNILGPPFWIPKNRCQIRNQRPQKPWSTELCENRWISIRPPYGVRNFEFRKSDVKFIISHPESFSVQSFAVIVWFFKITCPTYWISAILRRV